MPESSRQSTRVIQVSNISPVASREQIYQLFSYLGKIDDIKVYPSETNPMYASMTQKLAYVKFDDSSSVKTSQHVTNTVFIDRAVICVPVPENRIPDEDTALKTGGPAWPGQRQLPPNVLNQIQTMGDQQVVVTIDPTLSALGLPNYPSLPSNTEASKIEEIRRTIYVGNIPKDAESKDIMEFFNDMIGEVMYLRMAGGDNLSTRYCYVEFSNQSTVPIALQNNGVFFQTKRLSIQHSRVAIIKPQVKTQDTAKREIQEALKKQQTVGLNMPGSISSHVLNLRLSHNDKFRQRSRSRSRSPEFFRRRFGRSRSPPGRWRGGGRGGRFRSPPRFRRQRSRSRQRDRDRRRSSRDKKRKRSRSRSSSGSPSASKKDKEKREKDRKSDRKKSKEIKKEKSPVDLESVEAKEVDAILEEALGKRPPPPVKTEPPDEEEEMAATEILSKVKPKYKKRDDSDSEEERRKKRRERRKRRDSSSEEERKKSSKKKKEKKKKKKRSSSSSDSSSD